MPKPCQRPTPVIVMVSTILDAHGASFIETDGPKASAEFREGNYSRSAVNCEAHCRYQFGCVDTRLQWPGNDTVILHVRDTSGDTK